MFLLNNYSFLFSYRCSIDKTVKFHPINDKRTQKFSLEAFAFLDDHMFVYMHCRVKICNASDPNSRCAQGCIRRAKRAVTTLESKDDEVTLAEGPFMREDSDEKTELEETEKEPRALKKGGKFKIHSISANNQAIFPNPNLYGPYPSSKNSHFQRKGKWKTFLVKMSFICMRTK